MLIVSFLIYEKIPLRGSSHNDLHKFIKDKKTVINIKNSDNEGSRLAVLRAIRPMNKNVKCTSNLKSKVFTLNGGNMTFPVKTSDVDKLKQLNPKSTVNVFTLEGTRVYPLYPTSRLRTILTRCCTTNAVV